MTTTNVTIKVETQGTRQVEQLERSFQKTESASKKLQSSLGGLVGKLAAVTGVAIGLGSAFNSIVKFDKAQSALRTLGVNAEELTGKLNEVSKELNGAVSTAELTGAAFQVASAGFKKAGDNAKILEAAAVSSKAKFADLGVVAAATTSVLNAYGLGANKAKEVNDKFFQTIKDGVITIEEYSTSIGRVASISAQSGISLAEINSVIAIATQKGVQGAEAFTGLGAAISAIIAPSKQAKDLAAELGIEFSEAALRQKGLVGVLEDVQRATGGSNEKLTTLFGSIEALKTLTPALANNLEEVKAALDRQNNSAGVASKAQLEAANSIAGAIKRIGNSYDNLINNQTNGNQALIDSFNLINGVLIALNSELGDTIIKAALIAAGFFGVVKAVLALKAAIVALKATALAGWITSQIALLTTFGVKIYATAAAKGVLTAATLGLAKATAALKLAMLGVPWAVIAASLGYVATGAIEARDKIAALEAKLKDTSGAGEELEQKMSDTRDEIDRLKGMLDKAGPSADYVRKKIELLTAALKEMEGRYEIEIAINEIRNDVRSQAIQGFDTLTPSQLDEALGRGAFAPSKPTGGGGGGGGGAAPRASDAPQLQRDLELEKQLLENDRARLEAIYEEDRLTVQKLANNRVQLELAKNIADIKASDRYEDEKTLEIEKARVSAARERLEMNGAAKEADKQRRQALEGILSPLNEEIELLQARLNGNEKEIRQKQEIARLQNEIKGQGGDPAQAAGIIKTRDALIEFNKQQDETKEKAEEIAGVLAGSLVGGLEAVVAGTKTAEEAFADFLDSIAKMLIKTATTMIAQYIAIGIARIFAGVPPGPSGGGFNPSAPSITGNSLGNFGGGTPFFAEGGYVTSPTNALIGEGGEPEYVVPASKMDSAMSRYNSGARGDAVIEGASKSSSGGGTAVAEQPTTINIEGGVMQFNDTNYIRQDQIPAIVAQAGKQGEARALRKMQMSPGTRKRVGI